VPQEDRKPSEERPPDVEIGATAKAKRLRFEERPESEVEFTGESIAESDSGSERENLPDEVEPNVTYRDVRIGWRAAAWVENAADEPEDEDGEDGR
jgi:hypothetical protein